MEAHVDLLAWFDRHGRHDLPWRRTSDPYHIYISEIMLQQTQVERVREYYERFLRRFPTLKSLSQSDIDEVLALWSGLGYYRRARNLHAASRACDGRLPTEYHELLKLPGIGEYTASAICSFAYDQPIAVIDTNIDRLLRRLFATDRPKEYALSFLNIHSPKRHNLALMDLGSMICTPKNPACHHCPLHRFCLGKEEPGRYLRRKAQKRQKKELHLCFWIRGDALALIRSKENLYKGMLTLPAAKPEGKPIATFSHSYTRYDLTIHLHSQRPEGDIEWIPLQKLSHSPINNIVKKALRLLCQAPF